MLPPFVKKKFEHIKFLQTKEPNCTSEQLISKLVKLIQVCPNFSKAKISKYIPNLVLLGSVQIFIYDSTLGTIFTLI